MAISQILRKNFSLAVLNIEQAINQSSKLLFCCAFLDLGRNFFRFYGFYFSNHLFVFGLINIFFNVILRPFLFTILSVICSILFDFDKILLMFHLFHYTNCIIRMITVTFSCYC